MISKTQCKEIVKNLVQKPSNSFRSFLPLAFRILNSGKKFHGNWHIDLIAHHLDLVHQGKIKRLIINMPPRALKSVTVNVAWPAWVMGRSPSVRILSASYSQILSLKHAIDSKFLIESDIFKIIFPELKLSQMQRKREKFSTTQNGFRFSTSTGGTITGEGGDILILDDPHNALHVQSQKLRQHAIDWFQQSFASRLDDKKQGKIVLVMQRLHCDDLSGFLLKNYPNKWCHLNIPAIADRNLFFDIGDKQYHYTKGQFLHSVREGADELKRAAEELGDEAFAAQYLQKPLNIKKGMVKRSWFKYYTEYDVSSFSSIIISWDTAIKTSNESSYSVGTCWGKLKNNYYLIDIVRERLEYPELRKKLISFNQKWHADLVLIEDKASGHSLIQDLKLQSDMHIIPIRPNKDKIIRLARVSQMFEAKLIYLPKNAVWRYTYEEELLSFPYVKTADQVDSTSQYLNYMLSQAITKPSLRGV